MLDMSGIEIIAEKRPDHAPVICAGGPAVVNPAPMSRFMDFMVIGDGEEVIIPILETLARSRFGGLSKKAFLDEISGLDGIYIPSRYKYYYTGSGQIEKIDPPDRVKKAVAADLDNAR